VQERIAIEHLVVSPFESGTPMARWHFPKRNRLMAKLACGMVLVEAGARSGTRHQVDECLSLGKPVFVHAALLNQNIEWLNSACLRRGVIEWRDATELAGRVAAFVA
jgi:DNA processing protein